MKRPLLVAAFFILPTLAWAQVVAVAPAHPSASVFPWGAWIIQATPFISSALLSVLSVIVMIAIRTVAGPFGALVSTQLVDQVLEHGIQFGMGAVDRSVQGKEATLSSNNAILNTAERYVAAAGPDIVKKYGPMLRAMLFSRLAAKGLVPLDTTAAQHGVAPLLSPSDRKALKGATK